MASFQSLLSHAMYDTGIEIRGSGTYPEFVYAHPVVPSVADLLGGGGKDVEVRQVVDWFPAWVYIAAY